VKSRLKPLPESTDKFWDGADKTLSKPKEVVCEHYFEMVSGRQAECQKCHIGFFLGPKEHVKDGHIYHNETLVI